MATSPNFDLRTWTKIAATACNSLPIAASTDPVACCRRVLPATSKPLSLCKPFLLSLSTLRCENASPLVISEKGYRRFVTAGNTRLPRGLPRRYFGARDSTKQSARVRCFRQAAESCRVTTANPSCAGIAARSTSLRTRPCAPQNITGPSAGYSNAFSIVRLRTGPQVSRPWDPFWASNRGFRLCPSFWVSAVGSYRSFC
jgi:hypothetical protein